MQALAGGHWWDGQRTPKRQGDQRDGGGGRGTNASGYISPPPIPRCSSGGSRNGGPRKSHQWFNMHSLNSPSGFLSDAPDWTSSAARAAMRPNTHPQCCSLANAVHTRTRLKLGVVPASRRRRRQQQRCARRRLAIASRRRAAAARRPTGLSGCPGAAAAQPFRGAGGHRLWARRWGRGGSGLDRARHSGPGANGGRR